MDEVRFMAIMDKLDEIVKRIAQIELNIAGLVDIYEEKLDRVIEFSETLQAKYLEDKLEKALKSGKLHLKFMKEREKGLKEDKGVH